MKYKASQQKELEQKVIDEMLKLDGTSCERRPSSLICKGEKEPAGYAGSGFAIVIRRRCRLEIVVFSSVHSLH